MDFLDEDETEEVELTPEENEHYASLAQATLGKFREQQMTRELAGTFKIEYADRINREDLNQNPNKLFIFGDNLEQRGFGGQAKEMRGEPNSFGIPTKNSPSTNQDGYFSDNEIKTK